MIRSRTTSASSTQRIFGFWRELGIQGTENLGNKLVTWRTEWDQANSSWANPTFSVPAGKPTYLGYVIQQDNIRKNPRGMTDGWAIYGDKLVPAILNNIVNKLKYKDQVILWEGDDYNLGQIPNLHSLIPYSMVARKPIFYCTGADGLRGGHISKAANSADLFTDIVATLEQVLEPTF